MALWTWWHGDLLPALAPLEDFSAEACTNVTELIQCTGRRCTRLRRALPRTIGATSPASATARWHTAGWLTPALLLASSMSRFNSPAVTATSGISRPCPRGVYPRLLQRMLRHEGRPGHRFWIINAPENVALAKGIEKAGFRIAGDLAFTQDGRAGLLSRPDHADHARAVIGVTLLGVPLIDTPASGLSPCWCCVMDALRRGAQAACWPIGTLASTTCTCSPLSEQRTSES
jgi:hypothetical protein